MALKHVQKTYDELGASDPLYAVLSFPGTSNNRWDPEAFFARGRREIEAVLAGLEERGVRLNRARALDFGCGVGRLTQALAEHFEAAEGVDISHSMVEGARRFNRHGERCRYHVNTAPDLSLFDDARFDFIYSNITLQHIPPEASEAYIQEFVRLLAPGGVALFQVPSGPALREGSLGQAWYRFRSGPLRRTLKRLRGKPPVEIHYVNRDRVLALLHEAGGRVLDRWREGSVHRRRVSWFYLVTREDDGVAWAPRDGQSFHGKPWSEREESPREAAVPSMLADGERRLYGWLTEHWMRGEGEVVDLGAFAGGSTARLAEGHAAADRPGYVHAYDRFTVHRRAKLDTLYAQGIEPFEGKDLLPLARRLLAPWGERVRLCPGEIEDVGWSGKPIEVLCVDVFKQPQRTDAISRQFYPSLLPGRSLIVHQDFLDGFTPWICAQARALDQQMEPVAVEGHTVVFLVRERLTEDILDRARVAELDDAQLLEALAWGRRRLADFDVGDAFDRLESRVRDNPGLRNAW